MTPNHINSNPENRVLIRCIIIIYLLMFIYALGISGYLLAEVIQLKPIPLIALLKYTLLCCIFLVLLINGIKAMPLKYQHLLRFESSVKNFQWLFIIALVIAMAAKFGLLNDKNNGDKIIKISYLQIGLLLAATICCAWSKRVLIKSLEQFPDEQY